MKLYTTARHSAELLSRLGDIVESFKYLGVWTDDNSLVEININTETAKQLTHANGVSNE